MKKKQEHEHIIKCVMPGSIAEEMELEPGDALLKINNEVINDIFDYHYAVNDEYLLLLIRKADGQEWELEIEKDYDEDLGIQFESSLMDQYRSCYNKCIFCFIDQNPKNMRDTIYFKDDDSRLSFLQGNYITLTNMSDMDVERIVKYKLAPINISVHTSNPDLRCKMLNNRFAGEALKKLDVFYKAEIPMNCQVVLCKGINDGAELEKTIQDMMKYMPYMESMSVVPVGLSKCREGLYPLEPFEKEDAIAVLELIHKYQKIAMERFGNHFVHASDEWYILAGVPFPMEDNYDGYNQLENGVGMSRLFMDEIEAGLAEKAGDDRELTVSAVTGKISYPLICAMADKIMCKFPRVKILVYPIENHFFGEKITVTGLLTGSDIASQLKGKELGSKLLLPQVTLKADEDIFLDDMKLEDLQTALQVPIHIVKSNGMDFIDAVLN